MENHKTILSWSEGLEPNDIKDDGKSRLEFELFRKENKYYLKTNDTINEISVDTARNTVFQRLGHLSNADHFSILDKDIEVTYPFERDEDFADALEEQEYLNDIDAFEKHNDPDAQNHSNLNEPSELTSDVVVLKNNTNNMVYIGQIVTNEDSQVIKSLDESFGPDLNVYSSKDGLIEMNKDLIENYTVMMPPQQIISANENDSPEQKIGILNSMDLDQEDLADQVHQAKKHNEFVSQFGIEDTKSIFLTKSKELTNEAQRTHEEQPHIDKNISKDSFTAQELEKAIDSVKFQDQDMKKITFLQSLNESGKEITNEQKQIVLKSDLTDEHKIALLTFLNDPDPKKTISDDYKIQRGEDPNKKPEVLQTKDNNLAQKTATGIEKLSRFSVD